MAARMTPKAYHHGDLYESLVKAGTELLIADGLPGFTLRECARRAGVSHAAPKNHFASVDQLLAEIAARGFDAFVDALATAAFAASPQTAEARIVAMGRAYVDFALHNTAIYSLMFRHSQPFTTSEHLAHASVAGWVQLETAVAAVLGPDRHDHTVCAGQVWAIVHGVASLIIDRRLPPNVNPEAVIARCLAGLPASIRALGTG